MQTPPPIPPGGDPTAAIITAIFTGVAAVVGAGTAMVAMLRGWRERGGGTVTPTQQPGTVTLRAEDFERLLRRSGDDPDDKA